MMTRRVVRLLILAVAVTVTAVPATVAPATEISVRPEIVAADAASGCPSVEGSFVAVLDSNRGMLLLSAAPFPGGHVAGDARGSKLTVSLPGSSPWILDRVGSKNGQVPLWGARYPFLARKGNGCVGFDKQRWSAEGDLVTYLRWLVEEIYLEFPAQERSQRPDFRLSDRQVRLRIDRTGFGPVRLTGKEGSTLACRWSDSGRIYLFMPFVLDAPNQRLAIKVSFTDGAYFDDAEKPLLGWIVTSPDDPGTLTDPALTVVVEELGRSSTE